MGYTDVIKTVTKDELKLVRIVPGSPVPPAFVVGNVGALLAGAGSATLKVNTIDGAAASGSYEFEHDQPIIMPSSNAVLVSGTPAVGDYKLVVDDGAGLVPTDLVKVGDFISFAGAPGVLHQVVKRTGLANGYQIRLNPELKAAPADNEAVTVYNTIRLNLPGSQQVVDIDTTGVTVPIIDCDYPVADASESLDTYVGKGLLGIETLSPSTTVDSTDVTNMEFTATLKGDVGFEISASGQKLEGDFAFSEVVIPNLLDGSRTEEGLYARYQSSRGVVYEGPCSITDTGGDATAGDVETYDLTFSFVTGDNFRFYIR